MGSPLAMANLYGFGRLAWDPDLSAEKIVDEWTRLTFGNDPLVVQTISDLQLDSWPVYESYTGPLGAGTLTNITGNHYDPGAGVFGRKWLGTVASRRSSGHRYGSHDGDGNRLHRTVSAGGTEDV